MRLLFLGDIIARPGRKILKSLLPELKDRLGADLCIGNVENAAGIFGITEKVINEISESGVDMMTSGNHIWDKREGISLLESRNDLLRPANYPPGLPGRGLIIKEVSGIEVAIINLQGRTFMIPIDCPFRRADALLAEIAPSVKAIVVDFHAEATSEKLAMGFYLDGRVSAVIGTHTHVPTADERILPEGTGFITDVGMVGSSDSVIGVKKEQVINRYLYGIPQRFNAASEKPYINGVFIDIDEMTGQTREIRRISETMTQEDIQ